MTFFEFLHKTCQNQSVKIVVNATEKELSIIIWTKLMDEPGSDKGEYVPPLVISGTPEAVEKEFLTTLSGGLQLSDQVSSNIEVFKKAVKSAEDTAKKGAETTVKTATKKPRKPATKKTETVKGTKTVVPETKVGETGNMFAQIDEEVITIEKPKVEEKVKPKPVAEKDLKEQIEDANKAQDKNPDVVKAEKKEEVKVEPVEKSEEEDFEDF